MYINLNLISNTDHWKEKITSAENHVKGKCIYIVNDLQIIANAFQQNERLLCQGYSFLLHRYGVVFQRLCDLSFNEISPCKVAFARLCVAHSNFLFDTLSSWNYSLSSHPKVLLFILILAPYLYIANKKKEKKKPQLNICFKAIEVVVQ